MRHVVRIIFCAFCLVGFIGMGAALSVGEINTEISSFGFGVFVASAVICFHTYRWLERTHNL